MSINLKLDTLKNRLKSFGSTIVAFSGGVDSSFLLKVSHEVLGNNVLAVIAKSSTYPEREFNEAIKFLTLYKIPYKVIISEELDVKGFSDNPLNRCYLCKYELFTKIKQIALNEGYNYITEGSNKDDLGDYRPGLKALSELGIISPLKEAELTKDEIRILSKELGLKTWDKPSFACLSSRFPYGEKITITKLQMIEKAEQFLIDLGFRQVRVRYHGNIARIEVDDVDINKFLDKQIRNKTTLKFKELGFIHIALDLNGYRMGSMNESILKERIEIND